MDNIKGLVAVGAAALGFYSLDAQAQSHDNIDSRLEHRMEHPITEQQGSEPDFFTLTGVGAFFGGINDVELNHQPVGGGAGGKLNLHIGLDSFALNDENPEAMENRLYFGLEASDMFVANLTGGVYDGFVNQTNIDLSLSVLSPSLGGTAYIGTGVTLVNTLDPWLNEEMGVYGNAHVGGRLVFEKFGCLELEVGGVFNEEDSGMYILLGAGVALPDIY